MNLTILSTDTPHHRFFFQKINQSFNIDNLVFETNIHKPKFDITSPFSNEEDRFEKENFFKEVPNSLPDCNIISFPSLNSIECLSFLDEIKSDVGIVFGTGKLSSGVLEKFSKYLMNIHRGIPQYYRGLDSDLWAIENGDFNNIGTTIHLVEPELDTGEIVGQSTLKIDKKMKIFHLRYHTTIIATDLVLKALDSIKKGNLKTTPQHRRGEYFSFMPAVKKNEAARKFSNYCLTLGT